ncbi:outer membrane protein, partial [Sphingomonas daechungensis]
MRNILLAAVAAAAIASPAVARDGSGYVGVELGPMLAEDTKLDYDDGVNSFTDTVAVDYNTGWDLGLYGGYDFGMIRTEVDLSYKRAGVNEVVLDAPLCSTITNCIQDADGHASVLSAMGNLLLDFGDDNGLGGYVGAGVGFASVDLDATAAGGGSVDDKDSGVA